MSIHKQVVKVDGRSRSLYWGRPDGCFRAFIAVDRTTYWWKMNDGEQVYHVDPGIVPGSKRVDPASIPDEIREHLDWARDQILATSP